MTDAELKKLNRTQLLEQLVAQGREIERLRGKLQVADEKLRDRQLEIDMAGSIAEAAMSINGVFEAAEKAAEQYLENIRALSERQESICESLEEDARKKAADIIANAEIEAKKRIKEADEYYKRTLRRARRMEGQPVKGFLNETQNE